jgi:Penicillin-insensitive murein endopeptidase
MPERRLSNEERETMSAVNMVTDDGLSVDRAHWTPGQAAIIKAAAEEPEVDHIFVNAAIKKALCETANSHRRANPRASPGNDRRLALERMHPRSCSQSVLLLGLRISCILEVCGAFGGRVLGEDFAAGVGDGFVSSRTGLSQQGLELGEHLLDRVEVGGELSRELGFGRNESQKDWLVFRPRSPHANSATLRF